MEVNIRYCKECSNTMAIQGLNFECLNCKAQVPIENGTVIYKKKTEVSNLSTVDVKLKSNDFSKLNPVHGCVYRKCTNSKCTSKEVAKHRKVVSSNNDIQYICLECKS